MPTDQRFARPSDYLPSAEWIRALPDPDEDHPLRVLMSGCLYGWQCGVNGDNYGGHWPTVRAFLDSPKVRVTPFCPEQVAMGTPREMPNCEGGNGFDVLRGRARFITEDSRRDFSAALIAASEQMLEVARANDCQLAVLMSISGACGTDSIYDGPRVNKRYQRGPGVAAAVLMSAGLPCLAQRDMRTLHRLYAKIDPQHVVDPEARDAWEQRWYQSTFS